MSSTLLEKTRRLNRAIQNSGSDPVRFSDLAGVLSEILNSNVFVTSRRGRILGYHLADNSGFREFLSDSVDELKFMDEFNISLLQITETKAIIFLGQNSLFSESAHDTPENGFITIIPINCGGSRLGTMIFERNGQKYTDSDLVVAEYSATVAGMEIMRAKAEEIEKETREKAVVEIAVGTLSYSELEAVGHVFSELDGSEGLLVASKIADRAGITRSVIVNALRKLESAGAIESRSLGMKGTYIRILNDKLLDALERVNNK